MSTQKTLKRASIEGFKTILTVVLDICEVKAKADNPNLIDHPLIESKQRLVVNGETGEQSTVDILTDIETLEDYKDEIRQKIKDAKTISDLNRLITKDYKIQVFRWASRSMSERQITEYLQENLVFIEAAEKNTQFLIDVLKPICDGLITNERDKVTFLNMPETIMVYKGVVNNQKPEHSIVWVMDAKVAKWMAMKPDGGQGQVCAAKISKEHVLSYYTNGSVGNVIIDTTQLEDIKMLNDTVTTSATPSNQADSVE